MKNLSTFQVVLAGLALVAGLAGCATSAQKAAAQQKEDMLQAAGFRIISASTPAQQQLLKTLRPGRVSAVQRKGQGYFVYPVHAKDLLYVGTNAQYLAYQQTAQATEEDALVKQEMETIKQSVPSPAWNAPWADWDSP